MNRRMILLFLSMTALFGPLQIPQEAAAVEVLVPNGGLRWTAGETREILWVSGASGDVDIEWSPNGGDLFWLTIEANAPNSGSYLWLVPNISTGRALVRITELSTAESDTSDATFVIAHIPIEESEGHLYLSADPMNRVSNIEVEPFVEFDWYVVTNINFSATLNASGLGAWEANVNVPPEIIVTQRALNPPESINVGGGNNNWVVGVAGCIEPAEMPFVLLHYRGLLTAAQIDLRVTLGPSTPSSIDPPDAPAWAGCGSTGGIWPYPVTSGLEINRTSDAPVAVIDRVVLHQNYPNPFNPGTTIRFDLPGELRYELSVYDAKGRRLKTFEALGTEGANAVVWDGADERGRPAASGSYFYRLRAGNRGWTMKMVLTR